MNERRSKAVVDAMWRGIEIDLDQMVEQISKISSMAEAKTHLGQLGRLENVGAVGTQRGRKTSMQVQHMH